MTPAQEFREARDWLAQHRRDPYSWLIFLMTLAMFAFNFAAIAVLGSAPASDAQRTIGQGLPRVDLKLVITKFSANCRAARTSLGIISTRTERRSVVFAETMSMVDGFGLSTTRNLKNLNLGRK